MSFAPTSIFRRRRRRHNLRRNLHNLSLLPDAVGNGEASNPKLEPLDKLQAPLVDPSKLDSKTVTRLMTQAGLL